MKRIIIASILTIAMNTAFAQMEWGVKIGGGSANLGGGANTGFDVSFGAFAKAELKDRFGVQFDALYSIKSTTKDGKIDDGLGGEIKTVTSYDFRYVEIPIQVFIPFSEHLHLLLGVNFASVSSARYIVSRSGADDDKDWTDIKGADAGMGMVMGLKYETATGWDFNFRYMTADGSALAGEANTLQLSLGKFINW